MKKRKESILTQQNKNNHKNVLCTIGTLVILAVIIVFLYVQLGWFLGNESDTNWLMVLHAGEAKITETSGKTFLTLSEVSSNTVFFADRPERKYQSVNTLEFLDQWDTAFAGSPPNAAMVHAEVGVDTEVVVIELFTPVVSSGEISFPIKIIGGMYMRDKVYTDVNLFIDGILDDIFVAIVTGGRTPVSKPTGTNPTSSLSTIF